MSIKTVVPAVFAAFVGFLPAVSTAGVVYEDELASPWFTAGVTNMSQAGGSAVTITVPPSENWTLPEGGVVATNQLLKFEADAMSPLLYTTTGVDPVAVVDVHLFVEPNVMMPDTNGMDLAQAALTVVTNTANDELDWVGLVRGGETNAWVRLSGDNPVAGAEYDVQIVIDNSDSKRICYRIRAAGEPDFTTLTFNNEQWLANPKSSAESISAVAFAGVGTIGEFSGAQIFNDGATIDGQLTNGAGFDFTNGTVAAVVTVPAENAGSAVRTATFRLVDFRTGEARVYAATIGAGTTNLVWDLSGLLPGGTYSYTLTVTSGSTVRSVKSGTFVAGNWSDSCWFSAAVVGGAEVFTNGVLTAADLNVGESRWDIVSNAVFAVDSDKVPAGSNSVAYVDTVYAFSTFTDLESLESLDDAIGGIVAVSDNGGSWCAFTGGAGNGWSLLSGGIQPDTNKEFVVRAEFDFLSSTKRVRYLVSADGGANFSPLSLASTEAQWLELASNKDSLSSVGMIGSGYVKSIFADIADKSIAIDAMDKGFATLWDAIRNGTGPFTLRTNATLRPEGISSTLPPFAIVGGGYDFISDLSGLSGKWTLVYNESDGLWYLTKAGGAMYIFF